MNELSEKIILAFIASLLAISLNQIVNWVIRVRRNNIIRNTILDDLHYRILPSLHQQKQIFEKLIYDYNKENNDLRVTLIDTSFNAMVFKSFKIEEIRRLFPYAKNSNATFFKLIDIYEMVDYLSKHQAIFVYDSWVNEIDKHEKSKLHIENGVCNECYSIFQRFLGNLRIYVSYIEHGIDLTENLLKEKKGKKISFTPSPFSVPSATSFLKSPQG